MHPKYAAAYGPILGAVPSGPANNSPVTRETLGVGGVGVASRRVQEPELTRDLESTDRPQRVYTFTHGDTANPKRGYMVFTDVREADLPYAPEYYSGRLGYRGDPEPTPASALKTASPPSPQPAEAPSGYYKPVDLGPGSLGDVPSGYYKSTDHYHRMFDLEALERVRALLDPLSLGQVSGIGAVGGSAALSGSATLGGSVRVPLLPHGLGVAAHLDESVGGVGAAGIVGGPSVVGAAGIVGGPSVVGAGGQDRIPAQPLNHYTRPEYNHEPALGHGRTQATAFRPPHGVGVAVRLDESVHGGKFDVGDAFYRDVVRGHAARQADPSQLREGYASPIGDVGGVGAGAVPGSRAKGGAAMGIGSRLAQSGEGMPYSGDPSALQTRTDMAARVEILRSNLGPVGRQVLDQANASGVSLNMLLYGYEVGKIGDDLQRVRQDVTAQRAFVSKMSQEDIDAIRRELEATRQQEAEARDAAQVAAGVTGGMGRATALPVTGPGMGEHTSCRVEHPLTQLGERVPSPVGADAGAHVRHERQTPGGVHVEQGGPSLAPPDVFDTAVWLMWSLGWIYDGLLGRVHPDTPDAARHQWVQAFLFWEGNQSGVDLVGRMGSQNFQLALVLAERLCARNMPHLQSAIAAVAEDYDAAVPSTRFAGLITAVCNVVKRHSTIPGLYTPYSAQDLENVTLLRQSLDHVWWRNLPGGVRRRSYPKPGTMRSYGERREVAARDWMNHVMSHFGHALTDIQAMLCAAPAQTVALDFKLVSALSRGADAAAAL